jgi:hypothetical protein
MSSNDWFNLYIALAGVVMTLALIRAQFAFRRPRRLTHQSEYRRWRLRRLLRGSILIYGLILSFTGVGLLMNDWHMKLACAFMMTPPTIVALRVMRYAVKAQGE